MDMSASSYPFFFYGTFFTAPFLLGLLEYKTLFDAALIRRIIKNLVYCGKIAYCRRKTEKIHSTRND